MRSQEANRLPWLSVPKLPGWNAGVEQQRGKYLLLLFQHQPVFKPF